MKLAPLALALASVLSPAVAFACPGACGSCAGPGISGYVATLGVGMALGLASVAAQDWLRKRRG
jgi:hypothetical protein